MADINIECVDCKTPFTFSEGEQKYYEERQFQPPKRCKDCRAARKREKEEKGA